MGDNTAIIIFCAFLLFLIIFLGLVWWLKQKRDWEEFLRQGQREEAELKRQEQERIDNLKKEINYAINKLVGKSIIKIGSEMGFKVDYNLKDVSKDESRFNIQIKDIEDMSLEKQSKILDKLFEKASKDFFKKQIKELVETNPKYYGSSFYFGDGSIEGDNDLINKYFFKYFAHKHIEFGSYIKRRSFTRKERQYIFQRDNYTCQICGYISPQGWFLEIDHIHPFRYGGSNRPDNLQTLCETCNRRKGAKIMET